MRIRSGVQVLSSQSLTMRIACTVDMVDTEDKDTDMGMSSF